MSFIRCGSMYVNRHTERLVRVSKLLARVTTAPSKPRQVVVKVSRAIVLPRGVLPHLGLLTNAYHVIRVAIPSPECCTHIIITSLTSWSQCSNFLYL